MSALCMAFHQCLANLLDQDTLVAYTTIQVIFCYVTEIVRHCLLPQSAETRGPVLGYHLKTPHQSLQMTRHCARLSGSALLSFGMRVMRI